MSFENTVGKGEIAHNEFEELSFIFIKFEIVVRKLIQSLKICHLGRVNVMDFEESEISLFCCEMKALSGKEKVLVIPPVR